MAIVSEVDKKEMSVEKQKEYCHWCWGHDYGNCDKCALGVDMGIVKPKPETDSNDGRG